MTEPFDQALYDAVMAQCVQARGTGFEEGWFGAAETAARIAAERDGTLAFATHNDTIRSLIEETELGIFDSYDLDRDEVRRFLSFHFAGDSTAERAQRDPGWKGNDTYLGIKTIAPGVPYAGPPERAPAVSDEELLDMWAGAVEQFWQGEGRPWLGTREEPQVHDKARIAGIRAVRAALTPGPAVPVIPDGATDFTVDFVLPGGEYRSGYGPTWLDALNAAIAVAKENDK